MFYPQRVVDIKDGITKYAGLDNQSDILDDDGNLLKKFEDVKNEREHEKGETNGAKRQKMDEEEKPPHPSDPKESNM